MLDDELPRSGSSPSGAGAVRRRHRRGLRAAAWVAAATVLAGAAGAGYVYYRLDGNIHSVDIDAALGGHRPAPLGDGALDILVLGSDSRSGANHEYGHDTGTSRSDTAMVVHLYKGHRSAAVVSIPRDTLIDRPPCTLTGKAAKDALAARGNAKGDAKGPGGPGGTLTSPAAHGVMFHSAYEIGGPVCAVKTVEQLTGLRMDHYVEVDFTGFKHLVDALGGVPVTTTRAIHDRKSHLDLAAGTHTLDGEQALGLVRTRHGVADGSDLGRIQLQQIFMKALLDRISGLGVLSSPTKLFHVADTATSAVTTDTGLGSVDKLMGLADGTKHLNGSNVRMVTLPVQYAVSDPNRVVPIDSRAHMLWQALREGRPVPAAVTKGSVAAEVDAGTTVSPAPTRSPGHS
jgi:LCP family protein required for cell wall assembly